MIKTTIKKASSQFSIIISIILGIVALWLIITMIVNLNEVGKENARVSKCIASVEAHASFVEQNLLIAEGTEEVVGGVAAFFPKTEVDPPEIECDSRLIKSKSKTAKEAEKELLTSALKTWAMFRNGKSMFYPDLKSASFCFVTDIYEFKKDFDFDFIAASKSYKLGKLNKFYASGETVYDYFTKDIPEDLAVVDPNFNPKGNFFGFNMVYYHGDIPEEVYDHGSWFDKTLNSIVDIFWITDKDSKRQGLEQISDDYNFFNFVSGEMIHENIDKYKNPKKLYAVVFYQKNVMPEKG